MSRSPDVPSTLRSLPFPAVAYGLLVAAGCAGYFERVEPLPITKADGKALACGAGEGKVEHKGLKKGAAVFARVQNTGTCPMEVKQKAGGKVTDTLTVAPNATTITRYRAKKDFSLVFSCPAADGVPNPTCTGQVTLTPRIKGKDKTKTKPTTYEIRSGDAVTTAMTCADKPRALPITLRNRGSGSMVILGDVENTGPQGNTCPQFRLHAKVGKKTVTAVDQNGGSGTPLKKPYKLPAKKDMTFAVDCEGTDRRICDGSVTLEAAR